MEEVRPSGGRPLRIRGKRSVSDVFFTDRATGSAWTGCASAQMAVGPTVRLSPAGTDHSYTRQGARGKTLTHSDSSPLAREALASGDFSDATRRAMAASPPQRSPDTGTRRNISSPSGAHGLMGLACEGLNLARASPERY
ncbi:hypothetical protein AMECASPLE_039371 [Ameca splendens]|uniref:Uncharacterized protein n=1 Tax=Ameca splendens TaxID=208324 RepID=A0ABV0XLI0_9TELE